MLFSIRVLVCQCGLKNLKVHCYHGSKKACRFRLGRSTFPKISDLPNYEVLAMSIKLKVA